MCLNNCTQRVISEYSKIKINPILATELRVDLKPLTTQKPNKPKKPKSP